MTTPTPGFMWGSLRIRRDTAAVWTATNPILADGEPGFEKDTGRLKIGNGVTPWRSLPVLVTTAIASPTSGITEAAVTTAINTAISVHIASKTPHPVYDVDGPSLVLLYRNAKV